MDNFSLGSVLTQNIAAIIMAGGFLWYLSKRDKTNERTYSSFSKQIGKLSQALLKMERKLDEIGKK